ncbi:acetate--CoA ligase family protein [Mycolicibacterium goodii]|uniref:Acetyl-CoA synthetase n=1 Tax=Mycolicibacterium goodii TaxID=134601 RepID=A0A0K0XF32_MYCGD|nr:acetyl-CoA synthetase [Mycolicibacterium goodii]
MLGARSLAVVGASARPGSFGERMVIEARRGSARTYLVNPRHRRIGDTPCFASLDDLDEVPDLVLLGVPDDALIGQLEAAAAAGVRSAVLFGSAHGPGLRAAITDIATRAGMAVCGAACMGFVNPVTGVRALGYLEPDPLPEGGVSLVTHSGSAFSTLLRARRGFGYRLAVSSGQELVTDTADYLEYALDDPGTRVIALLLETPRAAPRLRDALRRAAERDVPVVILTVGGSPRGRAMVAAHSGALAGDAAGWAAFCAATGAIRTTDLAEFTDTLELFACEARAGRLARRPTRGGIATVHDSGAERALCADIAHDLGVEFAELSPTTLDVIGDLLDDGLTPSNPLDIWGTGADTRALFGGCLRAMVEDSAVAVTALAVDLVTEYDGDTAYTDAVLDVAGRAPLAVLASVPSAIDPAMARRLRDRGVAVLEGMRSGLAAMGHLAGWPLPVDPVDPETVGIDEDRRARWCRAPGPAFDLLADYGIAVPASRMVHSRAEAIAAAAEIGYPVAVKTAAAAHKSDVGGVALDVSGPDELAGVYDDLAARLGPAVTVDAMVPAGVEVSVGFVRDAAFGPLVVVAAGGVAVELHGDRVVVCPPVSRNSARRILDRLRIAPLLGGWRGAPPADIDALVEVIVAFSTMAVELGDTFDAVEANPVIASPTGAVAVDALALASSASG